MDKKGQEVIRSFASSEEAKKWAYQNGSQKLFIVTENLETPFTYWVVCEKVFKFANSVLPLFSGSYRIVAVYE